MLSRDEQEQFRGRLETLSNDKLLQLWGILGIGYAAGYSREDYLSADPQELIGILFADSSADELSATLASLERL